jgi:hypothetical protein
MSLGPLKFSCSVVFFNKPLTRSPEVLSNRILIIFTVFSTTATVTATTTPISTAKKSRKRKKKFLHFDEIDFCFQSAKCISCHVWL